MTSEFFQEVDFYYSLDKDFLEFLRADNFEAYNCLLKSRREQSGLESKLLIDISIVLEKFLIECFIPNFGTDQKGSIQNKLEIEKNKSQYELKIYNLKRNLIQRYVVSKYSFDFDWDKYSIEKDFLNYTNLDKNNLKAIDDYFVEYFGEVNDYDLVPEIFIKYAAFRMYFGPTSKLFSKPEKQDYTKLFKFDKFENFIRKDFSNKKQVFPEQESLYCIKCHHNLRDSCSKGLFKNKEIQTNPLNNLLEGCPLRIKISEMNDLYSKGNILAALSIAIMENPFLVLTGHRICNDCSKACIFQKQTPVDIPSIESSIVSKTMSMDYGFEIYFLLTRWNPLSPSVFINEHSWKKILVVGSGPSAIALSYYLLKEGAEVLMIDGQKIEPLPQDICLKPIKDYQTIKEIYKMISPQGFGGVCEYGITDRWNKENLIIARIILERFDKFKLLGGIKYGSNITNSDAIDLGFDHVALCCGAGAPNVPIIGNIDSGNVRSASDFLMSLGSGNLLSPDSNTNFMISLPVYVIGGGLTAVDTAAEIAKYYPVLARKVEKLYKKERSFSDKELKQIETFINAAKLFDEEDYLAKQEKRSPNYKSIIRSLGGIFLCYRQNIEKSSAYKTNHEELREGLEEGFDIIENANLESIERDEYGDIKCIILDINGRKIKKEAKTLLYAIGTSRNEIERNERKITVFGDMNRDYSGSVVKAIASAKYGYKKILESIESKDYRKNSNEINYSVFESIIKEIKQFGEDIFEIKIINKMAAKNFKPGQFFKLQNFHGKSEKSFEPIALTGAYIEGDIISLIAQKVGNSSEIASKMKVGEKISLSGPLGKASEVPKGMNVLLIGGGVGNAALFEYSRILKANANYIKFLAGYRKKSHIIYPGKIVENSDDVIFVCQEKISLDVVSKEKKNIQILNGNIIDALKNVNLDKINYIFVVGSHSLMKAVEEYTNNNKIIKKASINAPMCCMMGGVCGQCIIKVEKNGKIFHEFICANQDQDLANSTISSLEIRLSQNSLLEKLTYSS